MSALKKLLRKMPWLHGFITRTWSGYDTLKAYLGDAREQMAYSMRSAEAKGHYEYRILMTAHFLEKGMCYTKNPRAFGKKHVLRLMSMMSGKSRVDRNSFEFKNGISILKAWADFHEERGWGDELVEKARAFVLPYQEGLPKTGAWDLSGEEALKPTASSLLSRHSVRDFEPSEIGRDAVDYALDCFQKAPSACNRQMCKVYEVKSRDGAALMDRSVNGNGGLNLETLTYFIITFDIASLFGSAERNQGYLNAGLGAMNFANGLHERGVGTCFMQWDNKRSQDTAVRKALGIPMNEKIAVVIGAGPYLQVSKVACSPRKPREEVYKSV